MSEPFLGEIKIFSFNFAPKGWAQCNGQLLPINQNQALFSILGTTYGGDGRVNFALPDLRGRVPIYQGAGFTLGQSGGEESHTLLPVEMPQHGHGGQVRTVTATTATPTGNLLAAVPTFAYRKNLTNLTVLTAATVANAGGGQAHENRSPLLALNFSIALVGIFPSRN